MWIRRITAFAMGAILLAGVVWLGLKTTSDAAFVVWFGLASAILAPTGIAMIGYAVTGGQREVLQRLSKVPEIDKLISEAKTQEERIQLLEEERSRLLEAVQLETRRQTLLTRKASLEDEGTRVLDALVAVEDELRSLEVDIEASTVKEEIERLNERLRARQRGDIVVRLGDTYVEVSRDLVRSLPLFPGIFTEGMLRFTEALAEGIIRLPEYVSEAMMRLSTMLVDLLERIISVIRRR
jgi:hypothetical protein